MDGPFSAVLLMASGASGGKLSLVEHPLAPRAPDSPMHTHNREDKYSYIPAGQIGTQVGDQVISARAGDVIAKPSGIPHAFWDAGDELARVLEIIAPGGFEDYFADRPARRLSDLHPIKQGVDHRPGRPERRLASASMSRAVM